MIESPEATRRGGDAGFTLVETVVAFAILSLVMTTAVQIIGGGSARMRMGQDRSTALAHAQSQLAVFSVGEKLPVGRSTGAFEDGFEWRLSVSPLPGSAPFDAALSPFLAELSVNAPGPDSPRVVLKTILLGHAAAPAR